MKNNNNSSGGGGIGFMGLLTIVFITLKLTGFITWSWWWVLSPMILPLVVLIIMLMIYAFLEIKK